MTDEANRLRQLAAARRTAADQHRPHSQLRATALQQAKELERLAADLESRTRAETRDFNDDRAARPAKQARGPRATPRRLNAELVAQIIDETARGDRHADIGKRFRVHPDTISRIARGELWPHVCPGKARGRSRWPGHRRSNPEHE